MPLDDILSYPPNLACIFGQKTSVKELDLDAALAECEVISLSYFPSIL